MSEVGRFPKRLPPRNEYPGIDTQEEFPDIGEINKRLQRLTLALYAPISYLLPEKRKAYAKNTMSKSRPATPSSGRPTASNSSSASSA